MHSFDWKRPSATLTLLIYALEWRPGSRCRRRPSLCNFFVNEIQEEGAGTRVRTE